MTKGEVVSMNIENTHTQSNTNTVSQFVPYSVEEIEVKTQRAQVMTAQILALLNSNKDKWFCVAETVLDISDRAKILSQRSVYYTAAKTAQVKYNNLEYRVKGAVEKIMMGTPDGFETAKDKHIIRLYARLTS